MLWIFRYSEGVHETQGILAWNGSYLSDTLERIWENNKINVSCIPCGKYKIRWSETGHRVGPCYEVLDVPGRTGILIHPANISSELKGCIAFGIKYGSGVWRSKEALHKVHMLTGDSEELAITYLLAV